MSNSNQPAAAAYKANLYPQKQQQNATTPVLGVCLSGGGSRALSCALGQLSALNLMPDGTGKTSLSRAAYISSVSGGSWASVLYTYLPSTINESDFLIQPVPPANLTKGAPGTSSPGNVMYMNPNCMGTVPQNFSVTSIVKFLYTLYEWGFFSDSTRWSWFWIAGVGEIVLKHFGLYSFDYNPKVNYVSPTTFFSLSSNYVTANITLCNPGFDSSQFYMCAPNRPPLIVNANLMQDYTQSDSAQIPMQARPFATSIPGQSPDGKLQGGGGVESFAFTSTLAGPASCAAVSGPKATVTLQRRYSLCDIAGCSSAFFAAFLLQYLNLEIDNLMNELERVLEKDLHIPPYLAKLIVQKVESELQPFLDTESEKLIPQYNYWPLNSLTQPANKTYGFSDGGDFENTGILGLLAQTNANRILTFVNTETPLSVNSQGAIIVDYTVAWLFGYQLVNDQWVSFGGMNPAQPFSYVQVFSNANGEFAALLKGLYDASCGGTNKLGTATASFLQTLTTVANPVANIAAGRQIQVLWVYNNRVNQWQNQIVDQNLLNDLNAGQSSNPTGALSNFPNYFTGKQVFLPQEAVNMVAQLSAWNVQQLQQQIQNLLK